MLPELLADVEAELAEEKIRTLPLVEGETLDPNTASAVELDRLPGVGRATAEALVESRSREGPFSSVDDLERVPGIGPSMVSKISPHIALSGARPASTRAMTRSRGTAGRQVDLNRATAEELEDLPGIGPALAQRIIDERARRGRYRDISDLLEVSGIGNAKFEALRPKVTIR